MEWNGPVLSELLTGSLQGKALLQKSSLRFSLSRIPQKSDPPYPNPNPNPDPDPKGVVDNERL